ncbi:flagellar cap protein [Pseudoalteromonas sp. CO325X]|uniref:flagellar filament capping protein FliD n=1 Tax=Pseudoalteromonas TaxID=53246 RepID=UPI00034CE407|nr:MULTISPECIES: flagellar filament capping protein FliD [Pseudoalteromonas]MCF2863455.1 flagellar filament capping protein FliD [Pseudoalteromonas sp. CNAT2-18]MCG7558408.1 flagellar filament capping protein FliD [Pseudoalteromonas sp. CNAT2-18.1]MCG7570961.1 flagellar filament capping protein FliD [Pseudoalteromonas sp. CNC9-20]RZF84791.1 flagellar cap protein [Pseudoalteromonas sp. CO325X]|tara:strand:- start:40204 stop:41622 length:1419 start_codon:yes stop_codon:yes gene_type:complete
MPLITQAGIGSGLDLESIISASIEAENVPKMQKFIQKDERLQVELSSIGAVKSALSKLKDTMEKLSDPDNFNKRLADISQPPSGDIISVSPSSDITPGNFDVQVQQLAQGSRAMSAANAFADNTAVVSASGGTLSFGAGDKSFDVTLDAGATLSDLRDAINDSDTNFGVTANIINTGSEAKLVLTSNETGSGNDLVITNDNAELDAVSTVANGGGAGGMSIAAGDEATDAKITVDGIEIVNDSNVFKDAVQGMTITAKQVSEAGESAGINVSVDRESVSKLVNKFIEDYNNLVGTIAYHTSYDETRQVGLRGDATMRSLGDQLVSTLSSELTDAGPFTSIFDIGLGVDDKGYLEKSSLVRSLDEAMDTNYDDIGKAFAGENGVAKKLDELLGSFVDSGGILKTREEDINNQIDDLEEDVIDHQYRMDELEKRLRKQYSNLDVLLAQMSSTQQYLGAQLASLPGFGGGKSSSQ